MSEAFQISRHWRQKGKLYRLEGFRHADGSVTLRDRIHYVENGKMEILGRIFREFRLEWADFQRAVNDLIDGQPNNISRELLERLRNEGVILQIEEQYTLQPEWSFLRDQTRIVVEPSPVEPTEET